jgi:thioesterase domain-containing protein/acyl carrier protein
MQQEIAQYEQNGSAASRSIEIRLVELWEQILGKKPIGLHDNFFDLGGCSLMAVELCRSIERRFNKKLEVGAIFEAPTIEELANVIGAAETAERLIRVIPLQTNGSRPPFFCICLFVGSGPAFLPLTKHLGEDQPFYGLLPSEALASELSPPYRLSDIGEYFVDVIRNKRPEGPYVIGGFCADGVLAYEVARQLRELGEEVSLLILFDAQTPERQQNYIGAKIQFYSLVKRFLPRQILRHLAALRKGGLTRSRDYLQKRVRDVINDIGSIFWQERLKWRTRVHKGELYEMRELLFVAEKAYDPPRYDGDVALFRCSQYRAVSGDENRCGGWDRVVDGSLAVAEVPGDHLGILDEPNVQILGEKLANYLRAAETKTKTAKSAHTR